MDLHQFLFPVSERAISTDPVTSVGDDGLIELPSVAMPGYKAIVRDDTRTGISVVGKDYKLVPNAVLIDQFLNGLNGSGFAWKVNTKFSHCTDARMRLQVDFPQLKCIPSDGREIDLSMTLHNSYDGSGSVKVQIGGVRLVCTNGMVAATIFDSLWRKHTKGLTVEKIRSTIEQLQDRITLFADRIDVLAGREVSNSASFASPDAIKANRKLELAVQKALGKRFALAMVNHIEGSDRKLTRDTEFVLLNDPRKVSQWDLYNAATFLASHDEKLVPAEARHERLLAIGQVFGL